MGKVSYQEAQSNPPVSNYGDRTFYNFFNLKNDKDEAIVRIMHDSPDDFDIVSAHTGISVGNMYRDISCIREFTEPVSNCPFCAAGMKPQTRIIIHLLQYNANEEGVIEVTPLVWNRSYSFIEKLKSYIDNYGPLSDILCKIIRNGEKGSMQTTYEIVPNLNPKMYPEDVFIKDTEAFKDYDSIGTAIWTKSKADMEYYIANDKKFPAIQTTNSDTAPEVEKSYQQPVPSAAQPEPPAVAQQATPASRDVPPWERPASSTPTAVTRPQRNY